MAIQLSGGSIRSIMAGEQIDPPILQVLGVRKLIHPGSTDRYRIMLSDGVNSINFAMLATQHNHKIETGEIKENSVIRLLHHITSRLNKEKAAERRVLIVLDIELVVSASEVGNMKIGNPIMLQDDEVASIPDATQGGGGAQVNGEIRAATSAPFGQRPAKVARTEDYEAAAVAPPMPYLGGGGGMGDIITKPILGINPYQNKWVIRARVINKSALRTWSNSRGEGKLFSFDLKDESGEIRVTAFQEECDRFYNVIELNNIYYISHCTVKTANKKFTKIKHDFELTCNKETQIIRIEEDVESIPGVEYDFQPIASLTTKDLDALIDVIGVCKSATEVQSFTARSSGKELKKRDVTLVDNSNASITVTLWGTRAEEFDATDNPIVAVHCGKISEYQSARNLGTGMDTTIQVNPDLPEAHRLRGWFDNGGANEQMISISSLGGAGGSAGFKDTWKSLINMKDEQMGAKAAPDYFSTVACVMSVRRENTFYLSCAKPDCKKKVLDNQNGTFRCEKCNVDNETALPRMILSLNIADWSDHQWVTMFDNEAQVLLGVDGHELKRCKDSDEEAYNAIFDKVKFTQFQMKLRVKAENYNDESRLKTVVMKLEPLDVKQNNKRMLQEIRDLQAQGIQPDTFF